MQTLKRYLQTEKPAICSHRGYSAIAPENSMSAFNATYANGGKLIEFDVQMTKDDDLVVLHDSKINRTSNGKGKISELTMNQLQGLDFGSWFSAEFSNERIPEYSVVLSNFKNKLFLDIELKFCAKNKVDYFCEKIISGIMEYSNVTQNIITSFDRKLLKKIREINKDILTGLLIDTKAQAIGMRNFIEVNKIDAVIYNHKRLSKKTINYLRTQNKYIMVYTVNRKKDYDRCRDQGIDCIISNDPLSLTS